ncbi:hypothetical protein OHA21_31200 [Actinoplanes sp. NBC_00393]|uniref:hypothetical protein n=1 Tax=Actinoplanes sp. NBC_00393 TaxID=2975953 RepID=UPI002E21D54D
MNDSLQAYTDGHADGLAGHHDLERVADPETGADYRIGVADGSVAAFQTELLAQVRRLLGEAS